MPKSHRIWSNQQFRSWNKSSCPDQAMAKTQTTKMLKAPKTKNRRHFKPTKVNTSNCNNQTVLKNVHLFQSENTVSSFFSALQSGTMWSTSADSFSGGMTEVFLSVSLERGTDLQHSSPPIEQNETRSGPPPKPQNFGTQKMAHC